MPTVTAGVAAQAVLAAVVVGSELQRRSPTAQFAMNGLATSTTTQDATGFEALAIVSILADALIAASYLAIPCIILYFVKDLDFSHLGHNVRVGSALLVVTWVLRAIISAVSAYAIYLYTPCLVKLPARFIALETKLEKHTANERQVITENNKLHKLRQINESVRRLLTVQGVCDSAVNQISIQLDLDACYMLATDPGRLESSECLSDASHPHSATRHGAARRGAKLNLTALYSLGTNSDGALTSHSSDLLNNNKSDRATTPAAPSMMRSNTRSSEELLVPSPTHQKQQQQQQQLRPTEAGVDMTEIKFTGRVGYSNSTLGTAGWKTVSSAALVAILGVFVPPDMSGTLIPVLEDDSGDVVTKSNYGNLHEQAHSEQVPKLTGDGAPVPLNPKPKTSSGRKYMLLLVHRSPVVQEYGAILSHAAGQIELALRQSIQIECGMARRSQLSALEREKGEAEALNGMKSLFLATISHELRTPMNAIIGFTDLLLTQFELTQDMREILEIVSSSSNTLLTLVNDILDLSKLEFNGKSFSMEEAPVSIADIVEQSVEVVYPGADKKGILVTAIFDHDIDIVLGDKLRVRQILVNILSNAIKFTMAGSVTITLTNVEPASWYIDSEGAKHRKQRVLEFDRQTPADRSSDGALTRVYLQVRDTGIGISQDKIHLLFRKFQQLDGAIARRFQGTGLGLAITSRLVELHHGKIVVDSVPGIGTLFTVMLAFPSVMPLRPFPPTSSPSSSQPQPVQSVSSTVTSALLATTAPSSKATGIAAQPSPWSDSNHASSAANGGAAAGTSSAVLTPPPPATNDRTYMVQDGVKLAGSRIGLLIPLDPVRSAITAILRQKQAIAMVMDEFPFGLFGSMSGSNSSSRTLASYGFPEIDALIIEENLLRHFSAAETGRLMGVAKRIPVICLARSKYANGRQHASYGAGGTAAAELDGWLRYSLNQPVKRRHLEGTLQNALLHYREGNHHASHLLHPGGGGKPAVPFLALTPEDTPQFEQLQVSGGGMRFGDTEGVLSSHHIAGNSSSSVSVATTVAHPHAYMHEPSIPEASSLLPSASSSMAVSATTTPTAGVPLVHPTEILVVPATRTAAPSSPAVTLAPPPPLLKLHVLVADDNDINLLVAVRTLKSLGIERVRTATNGAEAVAYIETNPDVAICFLDVGMPVMDGIEATRAILVRALNRGSVHLQGLPFICAMTASALPEERSACLAAGMHDFVAKPARRQDLMTFLDRYTAWKATQARAVAQA
ncbi:hypothetical protein BC828DRAFT_397340 [Blastocladiella britannica]|nr:hypothetical protein BC828DRAFT_397340 [Blastocladiella britannica]